MYKTQSMIEPHTREEQALNEQLLGQYKKVAAGACVASFKYGAGASADPCKGKVGNRHVIAKNHLRLIAEKEDCVRANKDIASFDKFAEQYDRLQLVPIRQFGAGKWACQRHDERFSGIDTLSIDLTNPENRFKAVYRAVARHTHLAMARWMAMDEGMKMVEGRRIFRDTAFANPVSDEVAEQFLHDWRAFSTALIGKMRNLEHCLQQERWDSLEYRAVLLASQPAVAGWGCRVMKHRRRDCFDFAYMVVIPQQEGHAIITACEPDTQFRVEEITCIHDSIPPGVIRDDAYRSSGVIRRRISNKIWGLNELGLNEALYQGWSDRDQRRVQYWMTQNRAHLLTHPEKAPDYLPPIL